MRSATVFAVLLAAAPIVHAADDIGVSAKKLVVVDKRAAAGTAQVVFVAGGSAITKGAGTDPAQIEVRLVVDYAAAAGQLEVPAGASGWVFNDPTRAKFLNRDAPLGAAQTAVALIKNGKVLTLKAKGLGETVLDLAGAGAPAGSVFVSYEVTNGGEMNRHCAEFAPETCSFKRIASDTGAKLVCKNGVGASCDAAMPFCVSYQDCEQPRDELCQASRCVDDDKMFAALPGLIDDVVSQPLCVPEATIQGSDVCYTNSGACMPGCALSIALDLVNVSWTTDDTILITAQSDLLASIPVDPPFLPPCTLDWEISNILTEYEFTFLADGSMSRSNSTANPGTLTYSGCASVPERADIASEFGEMAMLQMTSTIGPELEAFLLP